MFVVIVVVVLIISVLLSLVVLVQNPKGGGLASTFSSSNQFMGVRKTTDFLEKSTWSFAIALLALSIISVAFIPNRGEGKVDVGQEAVEKAKELPDVPDNTVPVQGQEQEQSNADSTAK